MRSTCHRLAAVDSAESQTNGKSGAFGAAFFITAHGAPHVCLLRAMMGFWHHAPYALPCRGVAILDLRTMTAGIRPSLRTSELLGLAGLIVLGAAWLVPNKTSPWPSMWNEAAAGLGLLLMALAPLGRAHRATGGLRMAWPLATLILACIVSAWAQWAAGLLAYAGDAWLVSLYLGLFGLAVLAGRALASGPEGERWGAALLVAVVTAGLVATAMVLAQKLDQPLVLFTEPVVDVARPAANLGQPNHVSTLFFLALCCVLQLRREGKTGAIGALLALTMLTLAMGLARSRTGLLQLVLLAGWSAWLSCPGSGRGEWRWGIAALLLGAIWWKAVPWLDEWLLQEVPLRDVANAQGDPRFVYWRAFLEAAWQHPWGGWGWLQTGAAEASVAPCWPRGESLMHHYTHMLALDWLVWLGLPLGLGLLALLGGWLWRHLPARGAAAGGYWLAAVLGFGIHAMLEYPQAYLYFLLPIGLMMGVIDARHPAHRAIALPRAGYGAFWAVLAALAGVVMWDAGRAIQAHIDIRFENTRIGPVRHTVDVPPMMLLDQLGGYLAFHAADVTRPMPPQALAEHAKAVRRLPLQSSLLRYSMMLDVAGRPDAAAREQQLLCDFFGAQKCAAVARQWRDWKEIYAADGVTLGEFRGRPLALRCAKPVAAR